jgi:hypothetical protein
MHFEELWEKCEIFQKDNSPVTSVEDIINELVMKLNLYTSIDKQINISDDDMKVVKSRLMGEILLPLTLLSLKDNINVYEALQTALTQRSISVFDTKYSI